MEPKSTLSNAPHASFDSHIEELFLLDDHTYVPYPSMEYVRRKVWYSNMRILYSISDTSYTFIGPLPRRIKKFYMLKSFFPNYPSYEPLVFYEQPILAFEE